MYRSALVRALVPPIEVTLMSTASGDSPAGMYTLRDVVVDHVEAGVVPRSTRCSWARCVPLTVTQLPPASGPLSGLTPVTVGAATNVNRSAVLVALVPPAFVRVTSTVPPGTAGETAVIEVLLVTVKLVAAAVPKCTDVAPVNPVPVIVTEVPPDAGPVLVETPVTRGTGTKPEASTR